MDATTLAEKINQYSEIWTEIRVVDSDGDYLIKHKRPIVNAAPSRGKTPAILLEVGDDDNIAPISGAELAVKILGINPDNRVYIRYRCSDDEYANSGEHGYIIPVEEAWIGLDEAVLYAVKEHVNFKEIMHKTNTDDDEIDDDINAAAASVPVAFPIRRKAVPEDNAHDAAEEEPTFDEEEFGSSSDDVMVGNDVNVSDSVDEDGDDGFDLSILTELLGDIDLSTLPDDDEDEGDTYGTDAQADTGNDDVQPTETSNRKRGKDRGDLLLENALRELNLDAFVDDDDADETDEIDLRVDDDSELMGAAFDGGNIDALNIVDGAMNDVSNAEAETPWNPQPRKHLKIKREVIQQNALVNEPSTDEWDDGAANNDDTFNLNVLDDLDGTSAITFDDEFAVDSNAVSVSSAQQSNSEYDDFDFDAPATAPQHHGLPYINSAMTPLPNMLPTQQPYIQPAEVALRV